MRHFDVTGCQFDIKPIIKINVRVSGKDSRSGGYTCLPAHGQIFVCVLVSGYYHYEKTDKSKLIMKLHKQTLPIISVDEYYKIQALIIRYADRNVITF